MRSILSASIKALASRRGSYLRDDRFASKVPGLQCSVFPGASLAVVLSRNYNPRNPRFLVFASNVYVDEARTYQHRHSTPNASAVERGTSTRHCTLFARELRDDGVNFTIIRIDGTDESVVRDVLQMTLVLQPRTYKKNE